MSPIDVQVACETKAHPSSSQLRKWASHTLEMQQCKDYSLSIRLVDKAESQDLNSRYRQKDKPTNVLSFPLDAPPGVQIPMLGDIILCSDVINEEAKAQEKPADAHWAHMVVHGILHLLGFDHIHDSDALIMEQREIEILDSLRFADPYGDK